MRPPSRIPVILELVERVWKLYPDQRLAQLVSNACRGAGTWPDVFNVEDGVLVQGLEAMLRLPHPRGRFVVCRKDDGGERVEVARYLTPEAAREAREEHARGQEQVYWVEGAAEEEPEPQGVMQICFHCSQEIPGKAVKCRHCGKFTTEFPDLLLDLQDVEPDAELAGKLVDWPEANLRSALDQYLDDYPVAQQKAILLELDRRVRTTPP